MTGGRGADLLAGSRRMLPLLVGVAPLGLAVGAAASTSTMGPLAGWSTSWVVFSGTPQLLVLQLTDAGAPALSVVLAVALVNLRLTVYSASLAPTFHGAGVGRRALAAYLLTDPSYAVAAGDEADGLPVDRRRARYLGAAGLLWVGWLAVCGLGALLGPRVAGAVPAAVVLPLVLLAMTRSLAAEGERRQAAGVAFALAAVLAASPAGLPHGVDTLAAAAVATVAVRARRRAAPPAAPPATARATAVAS